jgi:predicted nucleic acid-binding protein
LGTLGIVLAAKKNGHIKLAAPLFDDLKSVGLRIDETVMARALDLAGES